MLRNIDYNFCHTIKGSLETPMSKWPGVLIGALAMGTIFGALFRYMYPSVPMSPPLVLLFALAGLIFAWLIRAGWLAVLGTRQ